MKTEIITYLIIILVFIGMGLGFGYIRNQARATVTDTVLRSERVVDSGGKSSRYLIYGKKETYEDTDSLWFWKWNSSDIYGSIQVGQKCEFLVVGWRVPFLSWYRNIITANCK